MEQRSSWEANSFSATQKLPAFYGTRSFITAFTRVRHLSLSWASPVQFMSPHPTSRRSVLILSSHLLLGLPSGRLPSGLPTKIRYAPLSAPIRATCPAHLILLDLITRIKFGDEYRSLSSYSRTPSKQTLSQKNHISKFDACYNLHHLRMKLHKICGRKLAYSVSSA
jgi:hypothetical protein